MNCRTLTLIALLPSALGTILPTVAMAGAPEVDSKALNAGGSLAFTISGGRKEFLAAGEPIITCTTTTGSGKFSSKTTGELELTFGGCASPSFGFPVECHSSGQANGVVTTGTSTFHNIYLTDAKTTPGILITPPSGGTFFTMICGGFLTFEVKGSGIIGHLSAPKCGGSTTTYSVSFAAAGSVQAYKSPTGTTGNGVFNLTTSTAGGNAVETAEVAERSLTFPESTTLTCV